MIAQLLSSVKKLLLGYEIDFISFLSVVVFELSTYWMRGIIHSLYSTTRSEMPNYEYCKQCEFWEQDYYFIFLCWNFAALDPCFAKLIFIRRKKNLHQALSMPDFSTPCAILKIFGLEYIWRINVIYQYQTILKKLNIVMVGFTAQRSMDWFTKCMIRRLEIPESRVTRYEVDTRLFYSKCLMVSVPLF